MAAKRRKKKLIYKLATRLAAVIVPFIVAFFFYQSWLRNKDQRENATIEDSRTKYEKVLEDGDTDDIKTHIESLLELSGIAIPLHIQNLDKRVTLSDRMIELTDDPKLAKFAFENRLGSWLDREIVSIKHKIPDPYTTALLRDESNNQELLAHDLLPLAKVGSAYADAAEFLAENNVETRNRLREKSYESFQAALQTCDTEDHVLANRMSELVDLINDYGTTTEGLPFTNSFIEHFKPTGNIRIQSAINDKQFGLQRTGIVLPEFLTSLPEQRESIIQNILITLDNAAAENKVDRETAESAVQRVNDMIRLGHYHQAGILSQRLRSLVDRIPNGIEQLDRYEAQIERYKRPFQFNGIVSLSGERIQLDPRKAINRLLLFASSASYQKSVQQFQALANEIRSKPELSSTRLFLVYVDNGRSPRALKRMKEYARTTKLATVWFIHRNKAGSVDVLKEHYINQLPFTLVLDREKRIVAANPPLEAVKDLIPN